MIEVEEGNWVQISPSKHLLINQFGLNNPATPEPFLHLLHFPDNQVLPKPHEVELISGQREPSSLQGILTRPLLGQLVLLPLFKLDLCNVFHRAELNLVLSREVSHQPIILNSVLPDVDVDFALVGVNLDAPLSFL